MDRPSSYDSLQIAYEFMERAQLQANQGKYDEAIVSLKKAESYAFGNSALLDDIQIRREAVGEARRQYIKKLEEEAASFFRGDQFDDQHARQALQNLMREDSNNELAKTLWAELPAKERAERERRLVENFRRELDNIWQLALGFEDIGSGNRAVDEYQRALDEASKKAGDNPDSIPLQRLKKDASEKRDRAKEKWIGTPTLIMDRRGKELVERYESLKDSGDVKSEFFDEKGEFLGKLPIDECIDKAKEMASRFADQKAQDYLGKARELLEESPGAAYDRIQDALALAYLSDFTRDYLKRELEEKIEPARQSRQSALEQLKTAMNTVNPEEAWLLLQNAEQMDQHTPGLEDARRRLSPLLLQEFKQLIDASTRYQEYEDFPQAHTQLQEAIEVARRFSLYGEEFQQLYQQAQEALDGCIKAEQEARKFDQVLDDILERSQTEPELASKELDHLARQVLPPQTAAKVERIRVKVGFRLSIEQLFGTLEQKMLSADDDVKLIPIEEAIRQAGLEHQEEERFQRLSERVAAHRSFLKGRRLRNEPEKRLEAKELLQSAIAKDGDDAVTAQALIDEITADEQQESDIAIAVQNAKKALPRDARLAFLTLQPFRYAVSRQTATIRQMISTALTRWHEEIDRQLEALVNARDFSLPKAEALLIELERSQSPRLEDWTPRVLAPAYASAAKDLQELNRWEHAEELWEKAFRLAPSDPAIVEGRRNSQKQRALTRAQMTLDAEEKERLLTDLNNTFVDDITVKRHLAEFYYVQKMYAEARLAVSQAVFLSDHLVAPEMADDVDAIHRLDLLVREAEGIERRKFGIRSQVSGRTTVGELWSAHAAFEEMLRDFQDHSTELESWWTGLVRESVNQMRAQIAERYDRAGTTWERAELCCKILALQSDLQSREQAERMLKLVYGQLPSDVHALTVNPAGIGYGPASQALANHIEKAKGLYGRLLNMSQVERISTELGLNLPEHNFNLGDILYELELTLENLRLAQERQREIRSLISVAMMTGEWEAVNDGLEDLERKGLSKHRGLKDLSTEVQTAKAKRGDLESTAQRIKQAMLREEFEVVESQIKHLTDEDPADETRLLSTLETVDSYTGQRIKGHEDLSSAISDKVAVLEKLTQWLSDCRPSVDWQSVRPMIKKLADSGEFRAAISLCQSLKEPDDRHQSVLGDENWSFGHSLHYLEHPPIPTTQINSCRARSLLDQAKQRIEVLKTQIRECDSLIAELQRRSAEFSQVLSDLKPLLERLNEPRSFFSRVIRISPEVQEVRTQALRLLDQARQICPAYPPFDNLEKSIPALRR